MVKRAVGRAARRLKGDHPRRESNPARFGVYVFCDTLLIAAVLALLAGLVMSIMALLQILGWSYLGIGVGLAILSAVFLLIWERVFWEPFAHNLSDLT